MRVAALLSITLSSAPAAAAIAGSVVDAETNAPIAGARVTLQATDVTTTTNAAGEFSIAGSAEHVVVAAMSGYFNGSVPASEPATGIVVALERVPTTDDPTYVFASPWSCASCHTEQATDWNGSPMARAGRNTWVYDVYDGSATAGGEGGFVYVRDSAHAGKNSASECAACHQPLSWTGLAGSALVPFDSVGSSALDHGVACDVCHKIADVDDARPNYPGLHPDAVRLSRPGSDWQVMYGLLGDVDYFTPGLMRASYQPELAARVCGTCHQDKNDPDGDGDFEEPDGVISEPTYLEWLSSPYADESSPDHATCVDCHMKPTGSPQACGTVVPPISRPFGQVRSHRIEGTSAEYLQNAVTLALEAKLDAGEIRVDIRVTNDQTGHHVPTGVTIRNVLLLVEAVSIADGSSLPHTGSQVLHELAGVGDPKQGYFAGLSGKLYAKINHGPDGTGPVFYTEATGILEDNRIAARATDATSYTFAAPPGGGDVAVRARLIYRRSFRALVDAKQWTTDGHGRPLEDLQPPHFGHLMEQAEVTVPLPTPVPDAGADAGLDGAAPREASEGCACGVPPRRDRGWAGLSLAALCALAMSRLRHPTHRRQIR
jgi:hypothetical protein